MNKTYKAHSSSSSSGSGGGSGLLELEIVGTQLTPNSLLMMTHEGLLLKLGPGWAVEPQTFTAVAEDVAVAGVGEV